MACKSFHFNTGLGDSDGSLCASPKTYDVDVSITAANDFAHNPGIDNRYWTMKLQRKTGGVWKTVGTRTGYVASGSPSHRTFTNVGQKGSKMRVWVSFWFNSRKTDHDTTQTVSFTR